jgi:hypothetical protein
LEYDYNFSVSVRKNNGGNWIWDQEANFGNLVFNMESECYMDYQRMKGYSEMPIVVFSQGTNGNYYTPAIANLTLMKTPLAELAFWISQSSLRLSEGYDSSLVKEMRFGPEVEWVKIYKITSVRGMLCMFIRNSLNGKICKQFYFNIGIGINISDSTGSWDFNTFSGISPFQKVLPNDCNSITVDADINRIPQIILKFSS